MENNEYIKTIEEKIIAEKQKIKNVNIIVAGKSGIGKSTLINAVFREKLATTGIGKPVTQEIELYQKRGLPIRIYDTVGLELNRDSQRKTIKAMKKLIESKRQNLSVDDDIHFMWYCISVPLDRIEDLEIDFIKEINELNIPVIIVLTKVFSKSAASRFAEKIKAMQLPIVDIVQVLAEDDGEIKAFGLNELVEKTSAILPQAIQVGFANVQNYALVLRKKEARKIITFYALNLDSSVKDLFNNIDNFEYVEQQSQMLVKISELYGVDTSLNKISEIIALICEMMLLMLQNKEVEYQESKSIFKDLAKLNSKKEISEKIGYAYVSFLEKVVLKEIDLETLSMEEFISIYHQQLDK